MFYDDAGAIGRRYRRQDEIGTPWCVTIDFETIEKPGDTFTLRERDSLAWRSRAAPEVVGAQAGGALAPPWKTPARLTAEALDLDFIPNNRV